MCLFLLSVALVADARCPQVESWYGTAGCRPPPDPSPAPQGLNSGVWWGVRMEECRWEPPVEGETCALETVRHQCDLRTQKKQLSDLSWSNSSQWNFLSSLDLSPWCQWSTGSRTAAPQACGAPVAEGRGPEGTAEGSGAPSDALCRLPGCQLPAASGWTGSAAAP